jgi:hypothetical protein
MRENDIVEEAFNNIYNFNRQATLINPVPHIELFETFCTGIKLRVSFLLFNIEMERKTYQGNLDRGLIDSSFTAYNRMCQFKRSLNSLLESILIRTNDQKYIDIILTN